MNAMRFLKLFVMAVVLGLLIAMTFAGCAGPRPYSGPIRTAAQVGAAFPRERVERVDWPDGSFVLVVYLRPRPAAPGGGMAMFECSADGAVVASGPTVTRYR